MANTDSQALNLSLDTKKTKHWNRPFIRFVALALPITMAIGLSGCVTPYSPYNDAEGHSNFYGGYYNAYGGYYHVHDEHRDQRHNEENNGQYRESEGYNRQQRVQENHLEQRRSNRYIRQEHGRTNQEDERKKDRGYDNQDGDPKDEAHQDCYQQSCLPQNDDQQNAD